MQIELLLSYLVPILLYLNILYNMYSSKAVMKEIKHPNAINGVEVQQYPGGAGAHQSCLM